jgi:DNA-binding transcriptional regulator YdaS (Cro superfamily)
MKQQSKSGLAWAVSKAGGAGSLANLLGVTRTTVLRKLRDEGVSSAPARSYEENAVTRAVDAHGGPAAVAARLGVSHQAVRDFMRKGFMPAMRARQMEREYGVDRTSLLSPKLRKAIEG